MSKKSIQQELQPETPAITTADQLELIDDMPDVVRTDLRKFNRTKQKISAAVKAVKAITTIENLSQVNEMTNALKTLSGVEKVADLKRKELGDPYRLETERINAHAKELIKDVPAAIKHGKDLILAFHKAEEEKAKRLRQMVRISFLGESGFIASPRLIGETTHIDWKLGDQLISELQVLDLPDEIYAPMVTRFLETHAQAILASLQQEKAGADFFGDDEAVAEVDKKIAQAAAPSAPVFVLTAAPKPSGLTKRWTHQLTDLSQVPREYLQLDEKKVKEAIAAGIRAIPGLRIYQDESITLR